MKNANSFLHYNFCKNILKKLFWISKDNNEKIKLIFENGEIYLFNTKKKNFICLFIGEFYC